MLAHVRYHRKDRGSAFLLAMVALVTLTFLGTSLVEVSIFGLARASREHKDSVALALAEAGVDKALDDLYENTTAGQTLATTGAYSGSFTFDQGSVSYNVTAPYSGISGTCTVVSTATTTLGRVERIRVIANKQSDVMRVFDGVLFSDSSLTINGALHVTPGKDAAGNERGGNSVYAKGNIDFNGHSANLEYFDSSAPVTSPLYPAANYNPADPTGQVYTSGIVTGTDPSTLQGVDPSQIYQNVAPIPMPAIDLNYYQTHATRTYSGGTTKFGSGGISLAGISGIIFVNGNVSISGSYSGQAMIVATGSISITGNGLTAATPGTDTLALLTPKSVKIAGGSEVDGLIYAHGISSQASATGSGDITIHGALVADVISTNGGINAIYDDVWKSLDIPGKSGGQWAKISWEELHQL